MARLPSHHSYADRASFNRLMLLISAIANNPGIAPSGTGVLPMSAVLQTMKAIAVDRGIECPDWSLHTIREDLKVLRQYGILRSGRLASGYYLGQVAPELPPVKRLPTKRAKLDPQEIVKLRDSGLTQSAIARQLGVSREAIRQAEAKGRR